MMTTSQLHACLAFSLCVGTVDRRGFCDLLATLGILPSEANTLFHVLVDGRDAEGLTLRQWRKFIMRGGDGGGGNGVGDNGSKQASHFDSDHVPGISGVPCTAEDEHNQRNRRSQNHPDGVFLESQKQPFGFAELEWREAMVRSH